MEFLKLIRFIDEHQLIIFTTSQLAELLDVESKSIQNYLETLAHNELIVRLEKGKYCRTFLKDHRVIGTNLVQGGVVAYESALQHHGFSEYKSPDVFVSSDHQKANKSILGYNFNFIKIRSHKYFGFESGLSEQGSFRVTDREKTILDCFDMPKYVQSFSRLVSILQREKFDPEKLTEYGGKIRNLSILKRIGYLIEKNGIKGYASFLQKTQNNINERYTLLNPMGPNTGTFHAKWRIRDNMI